MTTGTQGHTLASLTATGEHAVEYQCECGARGRATRAYTGERVATKAERNHGQHAKRAVARK